MKGTSRIKILSAAFNGLLLVPLATATPASAVELVTPYPAVAADFPSLQGSATDTFRFDLTLANRSGREATFSLAAAGPEGWTVSARPSTEQQAATVTVEAGGSATVNVEADPPDDVAAGQYELGVQASGEGQTLQSSLSVEITDSASMT
jgi:uncharacterized membrane protein